MLIMPCLEKFEENDAKKRARLLASLSQSFPRSALSKALCISCDENVDPLGLSCFADVCMDEFHLTEACDLTSLEWLQDPNLLKNFIQDDKHASPQPKFDPLNPMDLLNATCDTVLFGKHKPPYSFSCLIFMAIETSPTKCLPVKGIYDWIVQTFPYFHSAPRGWRNSVRHNLSLNKSFKRTDSSYHLNLGKGSSWCIDPAHRPNLLQALRRTPYHPFHQCQMILSIPETIHHTDAVYSSNKAKDQERFSSSGTNGGYNVKQQSTFADDGRTKARERIKEDIRLCNYLFCTAYPNDDHIYSIPGPKLEEARAAVDNTSVDGILYSRSESSEETVNVKSESCINLTNHQNKTVVSHESKQTLSVDSDENDEMKTLYFTSLALLELAAGKPPNSRGNKVQERSPGSNYDSQEASPIMNRPRARTSRRSVKLPVAIPKSIPNHSDELPITCCKVGKRRRKQPVPINSSNSQKKMKLRSDDKNLQILPNKTSTKKMLRIRKREKNTLH